MEQGLQDRVLAQHDPEPGARNVDFAMEVIGANTGTELVGAAGRGSRGVRG